MKQLAGYEIREIVHGGNNSIVYRAIRESDRLPAIIKTPRKEYPKIDTIARLKHEYEVLGVLRGAPGVIQSLGLEKQQGNLALVMEDIGGKSISNIMRSRPLSLDECLKMGIALASGLQDVHDRGVIHKDIKPSNIITNPETGVLKIIDFGIASQLNSEEQLTKEHELLEGTLDYIAPEQTGRMNRRIDYRSDFYSLGITLYRMLVGKLPFFSADPIELIHCHIARSPIPPHEVEPEIPEVVSEIVMKLLAKNAEDRYQSARGLQRDLELCWQQRQGTGQITPFAIAATDSLDRLQIPQKLYGRESEVEQLLAAFERASQNRAEMVSIKGYSGIGKSSLIQEIYQPILQRRGFFISGKFEQFQRDIPYASPIQALQELMRQILTRSQEEVALWKQKLTAGLGINGRVITDVIPKVRAIIGSPPPVQELDPSEAQKRFNSVFQRFISVFAQPEHPLVFFLDDLQWADSASLKLIQLLMSDPNSRHLLLIGAYRDNEVGSSHPLLRMLDELPEEGVTVSEIAIEPLQLSHIEQLVADTFSCRTEKARPLAQLCFQKTGGNPFFINQLIEELYNDGSIAFNHRKRIWEWDIVQIQEKNISDNIVDLTIAKIRKLSQPTQQILQLAACIGARFSLNMLAIVNQKTINATASQLKEAIALGLIIPLSASYKIPLVLGEETLQSTGGEIAVDYKFLHDRIQQAAYDLLSTSQKQRMHWRIAQLLLQKYEPEQQQEQIFDIVNHLNLGWELVRDNSFRSHLIQLNLKAGQKAKAAIAYTAAASYFARGIQLLTSTAWESDYDLAFELYLERSECEYLSCNYKLAESLFDEIFLRARSKLDRATVQIRLLMLYSTTHEHSKNLQFGSDCLKEFDIDLPLNRQEISTRFQSELATYWQTIQNLNDIRELLELKKMSDPQVEVCTRLLMEMTGSAYFVNPEVYGLIALILVNLSMEYGNGELSSFHYAVWGTISCAKLLDCENGYAFGVLALELTRRADNAYLKCRVFNQVGAHVTPWKSPIRESIAILKCGIEAGMEYADTYTSYCIANLTIQRLFKGEDLKADIEEAYRHREYLIAIQSPVFISNMNHDLGMLLNLAGLTENCFSLSFEDHDELAHLQVMEQSSFLSGIAKYQMYKAQTSFLYGDYSKALHYAKEADRLSSYLTGMVCNLDHDLFYSLTLAVLYELANDDERQDYMELLYRKCESLKIWAENCEQNFLHHYLLVAAEIAKLEAKDIEAIDLYDRAIQSAIENEFLKIAAVGNELAAKYWLRRGNEKIAKTYMQEAFYFYEIIEAQRKVEDLSEKYPQLLPQKIQASLVDTLMVDSSSSSTSTLDSMAVIRASQALAEGVVLDKILEKLMQTTLEVAGAQRGFLLLNRQGKWTIEAEKYEAEEDTFLMRSRPLYEINPRCQTPILSTAIVNYVIRTRESVILDRASESSHFADDSYIRCCQPKSVLCIPLIYQERLSGLLYLENNLATAAFTPSRVELLQILSSQAAISIENAELYEQLENYSRTLEEKVEQRTEELRAKSDRLAATLQQLQETQAQIVAQEKLASLGALTAGVAHEIKNPLNFINSFAELTGELAIELSEELEILQERLTLEEKETLAELLGDLQSNLQKIDEHGKRADRIVNSMLMLARGESSPPQPTDINVLLRDAIELAYHGMRAKDSEFNLSIVAEYDESIGQLAVAPDALNRAFLNILANACYALDRKRKDNPSDSFSPQLNVKTQKQGNRFELRIRDNGIGIPSDVIDRIFDPFFTTKPTNEGTGLGLAITHDIILQHRGSIRVRSQYGSYTEFIICLPRERSEG